MLRRQSPEERAKRDIIMDCGMGITDDSSVSLISSNTKCGLARATPGYRTFNYWLYFTAVSIGWFQLQYYINNRDP